MLRTTFHLILLVTAIMLVYLATLTPQRDGNWVDYLSRVPDAIVTASSTTLTNVRNWTYDTDDRISTQDWIAAVDIQPTDVVAVWFVLEKFGTNPLVGHSYLTFEMADGNAYSFSIEARREWGEDYNTFYGLFRQYEVLYTWSTERDALSRRIVRQDGNVYMHQLTLSHEDATGLLRAALAATHESAQTPRFYNTLTANCTNLLAAIVNKKQPQTLPYHYSWNLPGASLPYLIKQGYIQHDATTPIDDTIAKGHLLPHATAIRAVKDATPIEFSRTVREIIAAADTATDK